MAVGPLTPPDFLSPDGQGGSGRSARHSGSDRSASKSARKREKERKRERKLAKQRAAQQAAAAAQGNADPLSSFQGTLTDLDQSASSSFSNSGRAGDPLSVFAQFEQSGSLDDSGSTAREGDTPSRRGRGSDGSARKDKRRHKHREGETPAEREARKAKKRERRAARQRKQQAEEAARQRATKPPLHKSSGSQDEEETYEDDDFNDEDEFVDLSGSESGAVVDFQATDRSPRPSKDQLGHPPPPLTAATAQGRSAYPARPSSASSGRPGSASASGRPGSASASGRPGSASASGRPGSARPRSASSRPSSASGSSSRPSSASSLRSSATSGRPSSARPGSRPTSARPASATSARPGSARSRPGSAASGRPGSADARQQTLDAERVKQELEMWEQETGNGRGKRDDDRALDLVKEELEMWEKEVTISEQPDSPSREGGAQVKIADTAAEGSAGERERPPLQYGGSASNTSVLSDGRTDGISGDVQIHKLYLEDAQSEEPRPLGFVNLNLNECDGTLLDVRRQVELLDNAPAKYTFLFDGMPVGKAQESGLRAAFCDQLILRPDVSGGKAPTTPPQHRVQQRPASDSPVKREKPPTNQHAERERKPAPAARSQHRQVTMPGTPTGTAAHEENGSPGSPTRMQWKPGPSMTEAQGSKDRFGSKMGPAHRPFLFGLGGIPDQIIPPGKKGVVVRKRMLREKRAREEQMLRAREAMKDPGLSEGQRKAKLRLRQQIATARAEGGFARGLEENAAWKPSMEGPLVIIEHDATEARYRGAARELVASMRRAGAPVEYYLSNPRAAAEGSALIESHRSYNRYCFPDGLRFRPRQGAFEVYLAHPPNYQVLHSKLETGKFNGVDLSHDGPRAPHWTAATVKLLCNILCSDDPASVRTVYRCRDDTGLAGPRPHPPGRLPEPHAAGRPATAPVTRKVEVQPTARQTVVVPVPPPAEADVPSEGGEEIYSDDDFFPERPDSAIEDVVSEVGDGGGGYGVAQVAEPQYGDDVFEEDDMVDEIFSENDVYGGGGVDEVMDVVSDGSLVEEVPMDQPLQPERPASRVSPEAEYDDDFDDDAEDSDVPEPEPAPAPAPVPAPAPRVVQPQVPAPQGPEEAQEPDEAPIGKEEGKGKKKKKKGAKTKPVGSAKAAKPPKKGKGRSGSRRTKASRRRARPVRELSEAEREDRARLVEAAGLLRGSQPTPMMLSAYGGVGGGAGMGFTELRYDDARRLLQSAEGALKAAEDQRRSAAAMQYVETEPRQEEYILVPARAFTGSQGRRLLGPESLPQYGPYRGRNDKPGFSRDGWGVTEELIQNPYAGGRAPRKGGRRKVKKQPKRD